MNISKFYYNKKLLTNNLGEVIEQFDRLVCYVDTKKIRRSKKV